MAHITRDPYKTFGMHNYFCLSRMQLMLSDPGIVFVWFFLPNDFPRGLFAPIITK